MKESEEQICETVEAKERKVTSGKNWNGEGPLQTALPVGQESGEVWWKKELEVVEWAVGWGCFVAPHSGTNCPVSVGLVHVQTCTEKPITTESNINET